MKDKIYTEVDFHLDEVNLTVMVNKKGKREEGNLKGFGIIKVFDGMNGSETLSWDNLQFFIGADYKTFKAECGEDLVRCGFDCKTKFKEIKRLLRRAEKLNLL